MPTNTEWLDRIRPSLAGNVILVAVAVVLWLDFYHWDMPVPQGSDSFFFNFVSQLLAPFPLASKLIDLAAILLLSVLTLRLNESFSFISVRTMLPSLLTVVVGGLVLYPHHFSSGTVMALLVAASIYNAFHLTWGHEALLAFNTGFLTGLATLIFPFSAVLLLPFLHFYLLFNKLSLRTFLATVTGWVVPVVYGALFLAYYGGRDTLSQVFDPAIDLHLWSFTFSPWQIFYLSVLGVTLACSLLYTWFTFPKEKIKPRKMLILIVNLLLICLLLTALSEEGMNNLLSAIILLASIVVGRFFSVAAADSRIVMWGIRLFGVTTLVYAFHVLFH